MEKKDKDTTNEENVSSSNNSKLKEATENFVNNVNNFQTRKDLFRALIDALNTNDVLKINKDELKELIEQQQEFLNNDDKDSAEKFAEIHTQAINYLNEFVNGSLEISPNDIDTINTMGEFIDTFASGYKKDVDMVNLYNASKARLDSIRDEYKIKLEQDQMIESIYVQNVSSTKDDTNEGVLSEDVDSSGENKVLQDEIKIVELKDTKVINGTEYKTATSSPEEVIEQSDLVKPEQEPMIESNYI